jgi:NDP-sugar pyrophosphorylase family protein
MLDIPLASFGLSKLLVKCSEVIVNVDARVRAEMSLGLSRIVNEGSLNDNPVVVFEESPEPFGAAGTLGAIRDRIGKRTLTWNADTIADIDLSDLLAHHLASGASGTIVVKPVARNADVTIEQGRATRFVNRHLQPEEGGGQFIGVAVFEQPVIEKLSAQRPLGLAEALIEPLAQGGDLAVFVHTGYSIDVGTFPRYLQASKDLLEGRGPQPPMPWPGEVIAVAGGNAYVGPGVRVAVGTLRPGAVLLSGCEVRSDASVERAIVWRGVTVPAGEFVMDEVWPWSRGSANRHRKDQCGI